MLYLYDFHMKGDVRYMKFTCNKSDMNEAINIVLKAVPGKTTMPILECVVIQALEEELKLTTNDMSLGIETRITAHVEEEGIILVNAKMISDIIRKLPDQEIFFEADDKENILLFCGKAKFNLSGKNHEEFPMLPEIEKTKKKIDEIYKEKYDPKKNVRENIKIFHDYIINNTKYDSNNKTGTSDINSSGAYGVLFEGLGICSGYTDTMALFLEKLNVKNYRISSNTHVWNLVYVDGSWLHLDLTWDDPIMSDGSDALKDDYFLIDTNTLMSKNDNEHSFDPNIYIEAK